MRKAVLCFAHKDACLLNTLLEQFICNNQDTDIYIHLDKKSEYLKTEIVENARVIFIKDNVSITWGDDTMMRALFNSWNQIFNSGKTYDYFIMCTGQDLLVKEDLDKFLLENNGKIWLDTTLKDDWGKRLISRTFPRFICCDVSSKHKLHPLRVYRSLYCRLVHNGIMPKRKMNYNIDHMKFYYSFNWSMMPYEVFIYCYNFLTSNPGFKELFLNTILPEDRFLGTIIMNSQYSKDVVWDNDESWSRTQTYHSPFVIHPKVLTMGDIEEIEASNCYFARKFDSSVDLDVIKYFKNKVLSR